MGIDFDSLALTSARLIGDNGQSLVISRKTGGTYNTTTHDVDGETVESYTGKFVVLQASKSTTTGFDEIFGENLSTVSRRYLLMSPKKADGAALDFLPETGAEVTLDGKDWNVAGYGQVNTNGTPVLYKVGVFIA